jgi:hypothetical protein
VGAVAALAARHDGMITATLAIQDDLPEWLRVTALGDVAGGSACRRYGVSAIRRGCERCGPGPIGRVAGGCNVRCVQGFHGSPGGTSDYGDGQSWRHAKPLDRTVAASAWSVLEHAVHGGTPVVHAFGPSHYRCSESTRADYLCCDRQRQSDGYKSVGFAKVVDDSWTIGFRP